MKKLLLTALIASSVHAQVYKGVDTLGLAMIDAKMVANTITPGTSIGALCGTFGGVVPNLTTVLQSGKVTSFRVHLLNGPCWRGHNCDHDEPGVSDLRSLARRAQNIQAVAVHFPKTKCFISPVLEYDVKSPALVKSWLQVVKAKAPSCTPVLNPASGITVPNVLVERHDLGVTSDVVSNDGQPLSSLPTYRARVLKLAWDYTYNLRTKDESVFTPPRQRTYQVTRADIQKGLDAIK